jgi:hypothetical protein
MSLPRRAVSFYGVAFLLAAAIAPHRHLNSIDDLVSDAPSDSGILDQAQSPDDPRAGLKMAACQIVEDRPCLACFQHDFAVTAVSPFRLVHHPHPLALCSKAPTSPAPVIPHGLLASRSPPDSF